MFHRQLNYFNQRLGSADIECRIGSGAHASPPPGQPCVRNDASSADPVKQWRRGRNTARVEGNRSHLRLKDAANLPTGSLERHAASTRNVSMQSCCLRTTAGRKGWCPSQMYAAIADEDGVIRTALFDDSVRHKRLRLALFA